MEEDFAAPQEKVNPRESLYIDEPVLLGEVQLRRQDRTATGIGELDRVLGGGIVAGSTATRRVS